MSMRGNRYLYPIDAPYSGKHDEGQMENSMIVVNEVMRKLANSGARMKLIVLDCCSVKEADTETQRSSQPNAVATMSQMWMSDVGNDFWALASMDRLPTIGSENGGYLTNALTAVLQQQPDVRLNDMPSYVQAEIDKCHGRGKMRVTVLNPTIQKKNLGWTFGEGRAVLSDHKPQPEVVVAFSALLEQVLKDPNAAIDVKQNIDVLTECLRHGLQNAEKLKGKDAIFVIGNTGAGKSTAVNYLLGCTMALKSKKKLGLKGTGKLAVVVPTAEGGGLDEMMKVGHNNKSQTFIPQIATDQSGKRTYCDCPGFLDNRAVVINIANAANIRRSLAAAGSVKILVLISYHSMKADRGKGLRDMLNICLHLFGSVEGIKRHYKSLLLGVTQFPLTEEAGGGNLEDLKDEITQEPCDEILRLMAERLFVFDVCDRPFEDGNGWSKVKFLQELSSLPPLQSPGKLFHTVLTDSDEIKLIEIASTIKDDIFKQLEAEELTDAAKSLGHLELLQGIEHAKVTEKIHRTQQHIVGHYLKAAEEVSAHSARERFEDAEKVLGALQSADKHFGKLANFPDVAKSERVVSGCRKQKAEREEAERKRKADEEAAQKRRKAAEKARQVERDRVRREAEEKARKLQQELEALRRMQAEEQARREVERKEAEARREEQERNEFAAAEEKARRVARQVERDRVRREEQARREEQERKRKEAEEEEARREAEEKEEARREAEEEEEERKEAEEEEQERREAERRRREGNSSGRGSCS
jgi:hypothetical protein